MDCHATPRLARGALLGAALLTMIGCQSLTPFEDVATRLPSRSSLVPVDGQRVHVERWGERGATIVLLPGFAASTYSYRHLGPLLGEDFRVVAIDLNGFGWTERPVGMDPYTPAGQARMVRRTLDELGLGRVHVVGHSFGSLVALTMADADPELVGRLVLVSPATGDDKIPWAMRSPVSRATAYPLLRGFLSQPSSFRGFLQRAFHRKDEVTPEVSEAYRERLLVEGFADAYRGFGASMEAAGDAEAPCFRHLRTPVLILAGRHDEVTPLAGAQEVAAQLAEARLEILKHSGHSAPEEQPQEVTGLIRSFLADPDP